MMLHDVTGPARMNKHAMMERATHPAPAQEPLVLCQSYTAAVRDEWEQFVLHEARNATLLHTRSFFDHNLANLKDDASLVFRSKGRIVGVLPAALVHESCGRPVLSSHPRATYGGFVVGASVGTAMTIEMVEHAVEHARRLGATRFIVRSPFRIFQECPTDEADYALWLRGARIAARALEIAIPLARLRGQSALASYRLKTRNRVHKAQRCGVRVMASGGAQPIEAADLLEFWTMLDRNLRERHQTSPVHSADGLMSFVDALGPSRCRLMLAMHEGRVIAGALAFAANARVMHVQYIASRTEDLHLCPVNLIVHEMVEQACTAGFEYLNLGTATLPDSGEPNLGLFAFKEGFGGSAVLREVLELPV